MPGITGLETLEELKKLQPNTPAIMITKSEEEDIMEEAIGKSISGYIVKPFRNLDLLIALKNNLHQKQIHTEKINSAYQRDFADISTMLNADATHRDWVEIYKRLVYWDLEIEKTEYKNMLQVLAMQKAESNLQFAKYIAQNYQSWLTQTNTNRPVLSHEIIPRYTFPLLQKNTPLYFILIDNLRLDHWRVIAPMLSSYFTIREECYYSILPTATAYARNAVFSGLTPLQISKKYPSWWVDERQEEGKNNYEFDFLKQLLARNALHLKLSFHKVLNLQFGRDVANKIHNMQTNDLNVIIYNFVDSLSHASSEHNTIKELINDDVSYRAVVKSWFENSSLLDILKSIAGQKARVVITTDHGTIQVNKPVRISGDKTTNKNLRYKTGKQLHYQDRYAYHVKDPKAIGLPPSFVSDSFLFASHDSFFVYPNNYSHYAKYYKDSFQHGGISLEEMIIPLAVLESK